MSLTLLEVVQRYLERTDGFYVDDIFDTDESIQAAGIVIQVLDRFATKYRNTEFTSEIFKLDSYTDPSKPNYLRIPADVQRIQHSKVYYNKTDTPTGISNNHSLIQYVTPDEFLAMMSIPVKDSDTNYETVTDPSGVVFKVYKLKHPDYYTSFDGETVVFDSWDSTEDTVLQSSKTRVHGTKTLAMDMESSAVVPLPEHLHGAFQDACFVELYEALRQEPAPPSVANRARVNQIKLQQESRRVGSAGIKRKYGRVK